VEVSVGHGGRSVMVRRLKVPVEGVSKAYATYDVLPVSICDMLPIPTVAMVLMAVVIMLTAAEMVMLPVESLVCVAQAAI
jgi:hypothetical protein